MASGYLFQSEYALEAFQSPFRLDVRRLLTTACYILESLRKGGVRADVGSCVIAPISMLFRHWTEDAYYFSGS